MERHGRRAVLVAPGQRPPAQGARTRRRCPVRHLHRARIRPAAQDRQVQLAQRRPRLETELVVEQVPDSSVSLESVRRAATSVQRLDEQQPSPLPKRMRGRQGIEVRHGILRSADRHEGLETVLFAADTQLAPPLTGNLRDLAVLQLRQRVDGPPQRQGVLSGGKGSCRASGSKLAPGPGRAGDETGHIDLIVMKEQPIAIPERATTALPSPRRKVRRARVT